MLLPASGTGTELRLRGLAPGLCHVRVQAGTPQVGQRLVMDYGSADRQRRTGQAIFLLYIRSGYY